MSSQFWLFCDEQSQLEFASWSSSMEVQEALAWPHILRCDSSGEDSSSWNLALRSRAAQQGQCLLLICQSTLAFAHSCICQWCEAQKAWWGFQGCCTWPALPCPHPIDTFCHCPSFTYIQRVRIWRWVIPETYHNMVEYFDLVAESLASEPCCELA